MKTWSISTAGATRLVSVWQEGFLESGSRETRSTMTWKQSDQPATHASNGDVDRVGCEVAKRCDGDCETPILTSVG